MNIGFGAKLVEILCAMSAIGLNKSNDVFKLKNMKMSFYFELPWLA